MKTYVISDTHFNHNKVIEYCGRPENHEQLIWQGFDKIPDNSMLIHLGDFCLGNDIEVHKLLSEYPFNKILVRGNHDKKSNTWYYEHGWDFVCGQFQDKLYGKMILFSHKPKEWNNKYDINVHGHFHNCLDRLKKEIYVTEDEEYRNKHDISILNERHKLFCLEEQNYMPISLEKFINK